FSLMAAFLPREAVLRMFGRSLYDDPALLSLYRQLLGAEGFKPFECVGTREETYAAFLLAHRRREWEGDAAMRMFAREVLPYLQDADEFVRAALTATREHAIPSPLL